MRDLFKAELARIDAVGVARLARTNVHIEVTFDLGSGALFALDGLRLAASYLGFAVEHAAAATTVAAVQTHLAQSSVHASGLLVDGMLEHVGVVPDVVYRAKLGLLLLLSELLAASVGVVFVTLFCQ